MRIELDADTQTRVTRKSELAVNDSSPVVKVLALFGSECSQNGADAVSSQYS
jgi:hypothetical protein